MRHLEDQLQKSCIKWFDLKYKKYKLLMHSSPNGGKRNAAEAAKFKEMGTRAGFPDLIFLKPSKSFNFLAIELKTANGRQSEHQKEYQREFERIGAKYVVVRSLDEFISIIDEYMKDV